MDEIIHHPTKGARLEDKEVIVISGSSGLIGRSLIKRLAKRYRVVGLDRVGPPYPPLEAECVNFNIKDEKAIDAAMERIRYGYGSKIASVIHLAAYYSFNTKDSPGYDEINVKGTRKFLNQLQDFEVDQFIYSSSDLIYKPVEPGTKIHEDCPVEANWGYPESKIITEDLIRKNNEKINTVFLRIAGIYNEMGHSIPITQQIKRIYEKELISHFYSGDVNHGDVFVHLEDVLDALEKTVEHRHDLPHEIAINIGEPETPTYQELQDKIGKLIHGKAWETHEVPKSIAKAGAWTQNLIGDPFIKPWMIDRADDHYELDISRAKKLIDWEPKHRLMDTLPVIIENLKEDPDAWYKANNLK
ncbi:nucleoside-diphosphate sugar epimerase [Christiangramia fulva]|uniref:Nucleoside-diphosphate sugar epimerase n=1 Tax=Christiangramia fulva TaxID=2126553 RepID=A0A2R3Z8U4_9FLAO|nr:NAD(P)-dependent oxidoreductase [Christiangramia fulva]AVR46632.1 nucleoside-diphosphate sugar epimerase [Christiangramia fulva]